MGVRSDGVRKDVRGSKPRWIIDFRYKDKDGRVQRYRRDATVQTAATAHVEAERLKRLAFETGSVEEHTKPRAITFAAFVETKFRPLHMVTQCRPATRERYDALFKQGILDAFGSRRLDEPWMMPIRQYAAQVAARGVQTRPHLTLVRTVLRTAVEFGEIAEMPDVPPLPRQSKKLPDAPSDEDVRQLLDKASDWLRVAIALSTNAGLRMGEVRALEVGDVDLERGRIIVRHAFSGGEVLTPKSGHERVVPIAPELRVILEEAMRLKLRRARIIVNRKGKTPSRVAVLSTLKALERRIGVREWSFHSLRHYFCTTLIRRGGSLEAVRVLAGHSGLEITQRYVHASGADLEAAISRLGNQRET
jgi:integrase